MQLFRFPLIPFNLSLKWPNLTNKRNKMFHDIILALGGIGGDVLKGVLNEEIFALSVSIHPRENAILKQLIAIADRYKAVRDFIKRVPLFGSQNIILDDGSEMVAGMYLRAFSRGADECLEPYRHTLVKLEREVLANPHITLTGILVHVVDYQPLLATIQVLINQIVSRKVHGCQILQVLHVRLSSGVELVDAAISKIVQSCHQVMLQQLASLLLYGHLTDPFSEFFIESCPGAGEALSSSMTTLDSEHMPDLTADDVCYKVKPELVPSYIPPSIPDKAQFIGTTVTLFSKGPKDDRSAKPSLKVHASIYDKMENSILEKFRELQNAPTLDVSELELVMENARSCVTQHLFSLATEQADLLGELKLIKEFYLLGRGELFVTFLQKAMTSLTKSIHYKSGRELSHMLYRAARDVHINSDIVQEKFSIKVPPKNSFPKSTAVLSVVSLQYRPPWPLHLLFTPPVLSAYNTLFTFLLQVKIAELNLHAVWIEQIKRKNNPVGTEVWQLRNALLFLVHNLQCYLQLDVLESEFLALKAALDTTPDFERVIHHHTVFLTNITSQSFLHSPSPLQANINNTDQPPTTKQHAVNKCLMGILELCDEFCCEVRKAQISVDSIKKIADDVDTKVGVLLNLIALMGSKATGLRLLLLRIDYNRYFSRRAAADEHDFK